MSQGVIITLIICGTVAFLGLCGIGVMVYLIKRGMNFGEEKEKKEKNLE